MTRAERLVNWSKGNWFFPLVAVLLAIGLGFSRSTDWSSDGAAEAVLLFDLCLFVPALYVFCYLNRLSPKTLLVRATGLACLGVYVASWLVPAEAQRLIADLSAARAAGLVVLAVIELWVLAKLVRLTFGGAASAAEIAERHGTPEWVARLMLLEARVWKAIWRFLTGRK